MKIRGDFFAIIFYCCESMKFLREHFFNAHFVKFVIASGTSAIFNLGSRVLFGLFCNFTLSIILAYFIGMIVAYTLSRWLVFKPSSSAYHREIIFFILVNMVALVQTVIVSVVFEGWVLVFIHHQLLREEISHFIGLGSTAFTSYLGHKYFTFRAK
jgi:putative flippase GtrA